RQDAGGCLAACRHRLRRGHAQLAGELRWCRRGRCWLSGGLDEGEDAQDHAERDGQHEAATDPHHERRDRQAAGALLRRRTGRQTRPAATERARPPTQRPPRGQRMTATGGRGVAVLVAARLAWGWLVEPSQIWPCWSVAGLVRDCWTALGRSPWDCWKVDVA